MKNRKLLLFVIVIILVLVTPIHADILKKGSTGTLVRSLQIRLINEGYLDSEVTGYFGDLTKEAVMCLQKDNGLDVDGIVGEETQKFLQNLGTSISLKSKENTDLITEIQTVLKDKGFYKGAIDGIFGSMTENAIKNFQKNEGLAVDGIVGNKTLEVLYGGKQKSANVVQNKEITSRGAKERNEIWDKDSTYGELLDWWTDVQTIFPRGKEAIVVDFKTGKSFNIKRTYGGNHADCETLTKEDTKMMKEIWGGTWSWDRRPVLIVVGDRKIAASMIGMPHAGLDAYPADVQVKGRSGGFGTGINLDTIKGNGIDGHFCVHFLNSRTHGTNKLDVKHQENIKIAAGE